MGLIDYAIIAIISLIIGLAAFYVYKSKKSGKKCIGCPDSGSCGSSCGSGCSGCSCGCTPSASASSRKSEKSSSDSNECPHCKKDEE